MLSRKTLIIICLISWIAVILSIVIPEIVFHVKKDDYIEVTGEIVDTYTLGGDSRASVPRYYVTVEYENDNGERETLRGIKRAVNEAEGDIITFYLDNDKKPYRVGVLTENALFYIRSVILFNIGMVIVNLYMKKKRLNN